MWLHATFALQKAIALQVFAAAVTSGYGIMEACNLAAVTIEVSAQVVRRWAVDIFVDFFPCQTSLEDITDEMLEMELESSRGKHPKWVSLMHDENFRKEATEFILENGYAKGKPSLTLSDVVQWVKDTHDVEVCTATVSIWLHNMGFSYQNFSKGL